MKHVILTALFLVFASQQSFCQQTDEAAIIQLIESETAAFCKEPLADVVKKYWILDDKTIKYVTHPDGYHHTETTADMLTETSLPPENHATFKNTEYNIIVNGNMAMVTHTQTVSFTDSPDKMYTHEMRMLEKVDGVWKIHALSVHVFTR